MAHLFQLFLLRHAEALLFVDDHQAQVVEFHVLGYQPVGAHQIHTAPLHPAKDLVLLLGGAEPGEQFHVHREALHSAKDGLVMLPGKDGGRHQDGALLPGGDTLERRSQGHLGFAESHVAAQQPIHGYVPFHVVLDLIDTPQLVLGLIKGEVGFKIVLPFSIGGEGEAFLLHPLSVQLDQLFGDVLHSGADLGFLTLPVSAAQTVQLHRRVFSGTYIFRNQIQLGNRHIQRIVLGVAHLDVVLGDAVHLQLVDALEHADTVGSVDHVVSGGEL